MQVTNFGQSGHNATAITQPEYTFYKYLTLDIQSCPVIATFAQAQNTSTNASHVGHVCVEVGVLRGENLLGKDIDGKSDPYVVVAVHPEGVVPSFKQPGSKKSAYFSQDACYRSCVAPLQPLFLSTSVSLLLCFLKLFSVSSVACVGKYSSIIGADICVF